MKAFVFCVLALLPLTAQAQGLLSANRAERLAAAREMAKTVKLDAKDVPVLINFAEIEITSALHSSPAPKEKRPLKLDFTDAVPLTKLKAKPQDFVGKDFVVIGRMKVDDYYNYSYGNAEDSHYSFHLDEAVLGDDGELTSGEYVNVYSLKQTSSGISDSLSDSREGRIVRVTVSLERYTEAEDWKFLELKDVQYLDENGKWADSQFAGLNLAIELFQKVPVEAAMPLVDLAVEDPATAEGYIKSLLAMRGLGSLSKKDKDLLAKRIYPRLRTEKDKEKAVRLRKAYDALRLAKS